MLRHSVMLTLCEPMDYIPPGFSVPGGSPGKNTGVGCYVLLQGIFPSQGLNPGLLRCRQILSSQRGQQICQVANLNLERFKSYLFVAVLLFPTPTIIFSCPFCQMDNFIKWTICIKSAEDTKELASMASLLQQEILWAKPCLVLWGVFPEQSPPCPSPILHNERQYILKPKSSMHWSFEQWAAE